MLATEIIRSLKRRIRVMWVIIIILSLLLFDSRVDLVSSPENKKEPCQFISSENFEKKIFYNIPGELTNKKITGGKRSKKGNSE